MPLKKIPLEISPELLYALSRMGHGDTIVIADANFPCDSVAASCVVTTPIRIAVKSTAALLRAILELLPVDAYQPNPVKVMDRVAADKARDLHVPAYALLAEAAGIPETDLGFVERFEFYDVAKRKNFGDLQTYNLTIFVPFVCLW